MQKASRPERPRRCTHRERATVTEAATLFRRRVGEALARLLRASSWSLTVTPHNPANMSTNAGGTGSLSWYQRDADGPLPAVYVVDGGVLLRDALAIPSLAWTGSLTRLERVMDGREWIRVPLDLVAARAPARLPAIWAMDEFHWRIGGPVRELEADATRGVARYEVHQDGRGSVTPKATWELAASEPALLIPDGPWDRLQLSFATVDCPFRLPEAGEIVDAEEVWAKGATTSPRRRPPKPQGYQVSIEETEDEDHRLPWTLRGEALADALGVHNAVEAEDLVREALAEKNSRLSKKIEFDSEGECFFAYAGSAKAAGQLAQLIADLVQKHSPEPAPEDGEAVVPASLRTLHRD